jgi:hypothetical protein
MSPLTLDFSLFKITIPLYSTTDWWDASDVYPNVRLHKEKLDKYVLSLATSLFRSSGSPVLKNFDQCASLQLAALTFALRNPSISQSTLDKLKCMISSALGCFSLFQPPSPPWYVYGEERMGAFAPDALQKAMNWYNKYSADFERQPLATGITDPTSLDIVFANLGRIRGMTAVGWPIFINANSWANGSDAFRNSLAAHEMFHRLQYAYGLDTTLPPKPQPAWFVEGGASWAEAAYNKAVTDNQKIFAWLNHPQIPLVESSYYACLQWLIASPDFSGMKQELLNYENNVDLARFAAVLMQGEFSSVNTVTDGRTGNFLIPAAPGKAIQLGAPDLPFKTLGSVSSYAMDLYRVNITGFNGNLAIDSSGPAVQLLGLMPNKALGPKHPVDSLKQPLPVKGDFQFWIAVKGGTTSQTPYALRIRDSATAATTLLPPPVPTKTASKGIDSLGNVFIPFYTSNVVLGFEIDSCASIGPRAPVDPTAFVDCWQPDTVVGTGAACKLKAGFACSVTRITRNFVLHNSPTNQIEIQTDLNATADTIFYILIVGAINNVPPDTNWDGQETAMADPSNIETDGQCRPLFPETVRVDGNEVIPDDPIVPNVGRIWLPVRISAGHHLITELYSLTAEITI